MVGKTYLPYIGTHAALSGYLMYLLYLLYTNTQAVFTCTCALPNFLGQFKQISTVLVYYIFLPGHDIQLPPYCTCGSDTDN